MNQRVISLIFALCLMGLVVPFQLAAQEEEPPRDCPAFPGADMPVRRGYYMGEAAARFAAMDYAGAIYSYSCIIEQIDAAYIHAYLNRAVAHTLRRSYDLAIEDYTAAIGIDATSLSAYNNRGVVHAARREYEEALADFNATLSLDASYVPGYINRGVLYAIQEEYDLAVADFQYAIDLADLDQILALMNTPDDPATTTVDESDVTIPDYNADYAIAYALLGTIEMYRAWDNYQNYRQLNPGGDYRIQDAAGSLESRFTFELRFDDGTWFLMADISTDGRVIP